MLLSALQWAGNPRHSDNLDGILAKGDTGRLWVAGCIDSLFFLYLEHSHPDSNAAGHRGELGDDGPR